MTLGSSGTITTKYYTAKNLLIGVSVNGTMSYLAMDGLGSVSAALSSGGTLQAAQLFAPYGGVRYSSGTMPTDYGFTGQHSDALTGLDYYGARYYDPVAAQFTSADSVLPGKGYGRGDTDRYAYVSGDPETLTDPTGHWGPFDAIASAVSTVVQAVAPVVQAAVPVVAAVVDAATGISSMVSDVQTIFSGNASLLDKVLAGGDLLLNVAMDVSMVVGVGEGLKAAYVGMKAAGHLVEEAGVHAGEDAAEHVLQHAGEDAAEHAAESAAEGSADQAADHAAEQATDAAADEGDGCLTGGGGMSFAASTLVATPSGERPIASLQVGDRVEAYDPATGTTTPQTVQHTFRNHDTDLLDVTLQVTGQPAPTAAARPAPQVHTHTQDETVHTTANHPWYTADQGWIPAGFLRVGEPVVRADGRTAVVIAVRTVPGAADMWDLTVAHVHTFAVGTGQFVVHNCARHVGDDEFGDSGKAQRDQGRDRLRGRDSKVDIKQIRDVANRLKMTDEERWEFGAYVEDIKKGVSSPNDRSFTWKQLMQLGREYLAEKRGDG